LVATTPGAPMNMHDILLIVLAVVLLTVFAFAAEVSGE
jgi:hypothetical protein